MNTVLFYTSPARGHLVPALGIATELSRRGWSVHLLCLAEEVEKVRAMKLEAHPIDPRIESREMDDWRGKNPLQALDLAMRTFADRAIFEVDDLRNAIERIRPDVLIVDTNSWGAEAVAEVSGLPWATLQPYFTALPAPGVPPFGPGFRRSTTVIGRLRDTAFGKMIFSRMTRAGIPQLNEVRRKLGLTPMRSIEELLRRPPLMLYLTAQELEYPRDSWPENVHFVGPGLWSPKTEEPPWLRELDSPLALVTCSTERQKDRDIVEAALRALPGDGYSVVATTAAHDPAEFQELMSPRTKVERFVPHDHVIGRASVVICHGGMGITQRALAGGVPVVVVPHGRDQLEVARRVEYAGVGVRLMPAALDAQTLSRAVTRARKMEANAREMAHALAKAGGAATAADAIVGLARAPMETRSSPRDVQRGD